MAQAKESKSVFSTLNAINVNGHTEQKKGGSGELTYLSWVWAWTEVKKLYPDASYTIYKDEQKRPYVEDENFGLMCYTTVTIEGQTHEMWLPVMNRITALCFTLGDTRIGAGSSDTTVNILPGVAFLNEPSLVLILHQ